MRVLLVNRSARPHTGGANRVVVETAHLLVEAGHETALACWENEEPSVACQTIRIQGHDSTPQDDLFEAVLHFNPDVIQFHTMDNVDLESRIADRWPSCHFLHDQSWFCSGGDRMSRDFAPCHQPHGVSCLTAHYLNGCGGRNPFGNQERWRRVQSRKVLNEHATLRFQVASAFMRQGLIENRISENRIDLVPLFALPVQQVTQAEPGRLLVASRLVPAKGVMCLLQALATIHSQTWRLIICGDGPQRGELERAASQLDIADKVEFLGELTPEQLNAQYARCSVVISPTLRPEPFGLVGPEAMAHGRAVIAFDGGATREWLRDGETGFCISERTPAALAQAIQRLIDDTALCEQLGRNAFARRSRFSAERYLEALLQSFERARQSAKR